MIREPRPTDQSYIASTWVRSIAGVARRALGPRWGELGKNIDAVLDRGETRALVRVAKHDPDAILGYVVFAEGVGVPVVHYVYVRAKDGNREPLRQRGIGSELLTAIGVKRDSSVVCTSLGPDSKLLRSAYRASVYMPLQDFLR